MSLNWQWDDKMGSCVYGNGYESTIYQGNAQMIAINHLENDCYNLAWFSADKDHLRNMLGLSKGYDGCLDDDRRLFDIHCIRLNTKYKSVSTIVADLVKANCRIAIELYTE